MTEHCQETAPLIDYDCPRFGSTWNFIFFSGLDLQDQLSCFFFFCCCCCRIRLSFPFSRLLFFFASCMAAEFSNEILDSFFLGWGVGVSGITDQHLPGLYDYG